MITVYISIGNSDDKLSQRDWAEFVIAVSAEVTSLGSQTHGCWFSVPYAPWQNACWCVEFASEAQEVTAREVAAELARKYGQDSIAWATARTEFIGGEARKP